MEPFNWPAILNWPASGLIKGSIHVRHQPQDQGDAVDVGHGPLPQEKAGLENPPRMLGDWRF